MRDDIKRLLTNRPSWILANDEEYKILLAGKEYAHKTGNGHAVAEFEMLLQQRRDHLLN